MSFLNKHRKTITEKLVDALKKHSLDEVKDGLQRLIVPKNSKFKIGKVAPGERFLQETDTFDTWFSSGQWPLVTLGYPNSEDFKYFYPTSVLETGWEILSKWVSRMIMFGIYLTGKPPFADVYLHGIVKATDGRKMSKSLGNEINPEEYQEEFGTDALRMGLVSGTVGGKDFSFPREKIIGYRNFSNKIWNMARFLEMMFEKFESENGKKVPFFSWGTNLSEGDRDILEKFQFTISNVDENLEKYRLSDAADTIYHFMWDEIADKYIEDVKKREVPAEKEICLSVLSYVFANCLKLLHPFMPFVTEEIWNNLSGILDVGEEKKPLIASSWPK